MLHLKNKLIRAEFLHADTNLGRLKITLIIIGWVCQKWVRPFRL